MKLSISTVAAWATFLRLAMGEALSPDHKKPKHCHSKPNIILIMTDDQDMHLNSLAYQKEVQKRFIRNGTWFKKHFCTVAQCCPSRVSLLTGKAAHNTNVTNVIPPYGGYSKFIQEGLNDDYLPVWLQDAGYSTYYLGKLMNGLAADNYNKPWPAGWTSADFFLDEGIYSYWNSSMARDGGPIKFYPDDYSTDLLGKKALDYMDDAFSLEKPFFLGVAPVGPHSVLDRSGKFISFGPPIAAPRHENMFSGIQVPRTPNFNPEEKSSAAWIKTLERLNDTVVEYGDEFYRKRIQSLQAVDEMVGNIFKKLESHPGAIENTFVIYTSDNGFHIHQHRLPPGKTCAIETDVNIPFMVTGPGVRRGKVIEDPTSHTDFAPTIMELAGVSPRSDFDGVAVPITEKMQKKKSYRSEAVHVEYWGQSINEGKYLGDGAGIVPHPRYLTATVIVAAANNTYKSVRLVGRDYNLMYAVWCGGDHELYDMTADPYQMNNLYAQEKEKCTRRRWGVKKLRDRLNGLTLSLKSCKGRECTHPWEALHPKGDVKSLKDAMHPKYDHFYQQDQYQVSFDHCASGYIEEFEQPLRPLGYGGKG